MKILFNEAKKYIAGGVNSPVRAFKSIGIDPVFIQSAKGKYLKTADGRQLLDFCLSWGPMILGHANPIVINAVSKTLKKGTSFGAPTEAETKLAKIICDAFESIDKVRFVSSGTEAVMSAIRLARGFSNKDKILKFDGCYHGHSDSLLVAAGSGVAGISKSTSSGVPNDFLKNTISIPFNDEKIFCETIEKNAKNIAAVIVEPVPGNMGVVLPKPGFLEIVRKVTAEKEIVLIFDEVITGFRLTFGGAQHLFDVQPDMTILGKIIGGGFPVGAFGGKKDIMKCLAPDGDVYQAGTLSGNPVAMAAGISTLQFLSKNRQKYVEMNEIVSKFAKTWQKTSKNTINFKNSMFTIFHTEKPVTNFIEAQNQSSEDFRKFYIENLEKGIYLPPSMFETAFISTEHTIEDLNLLL
ncbi:MAG: glutamate-1-semialdehyde 2,1-aminomutase [Bacteroidales bacterium]|nr:glutamate-1-semialdehyde 2,1-aminomutase [Bacteroidales bacterium]